MRKEFIMADKQWTCGKCGAGLGLISWNGNGIPQLMVYRHAVDLKAESPAEVDVLGPLMGMMPIECDSCSEVKVWWPSAQVLLELLDRLNVEQLRQFVDAFLVKWNERMK